MRMFWIGVMSLVMAGCSKGSGAVSDSEMPSATAVRGETAESNGALGEDEGGPSVYGLPLNPELEPTLLGDLLSDPEQYAGKVVRTRGEVVQVCQAMGCWMELRESGGDGAGTLRVPMAGHAFVVPKDASGRQAEVEGTVVVRELTEAHKAHIEAEGATTTSSLSLEANGVRLAPRN